MVLIHLVTAAGAGVLVGVAGQLVLPARWRIPGRLLVAVGVAAAVLGTAAAWAVTPASSRFTLTDIVAPLLFGSVGVAAVAVEMQPDPAGRSSSGDDEPHR